MVSILDIQDFDNSNINQMDDILQLREFLTLHLSKLYNFDYSRLNRSTRNDLMKIFLTPQNAVTNYKVWKNEQQRLCQYFQFNARNIDSFSVELKHALHTIVNDYELNLTPDNRFFGKFDSLQQSEKQILIRHCKNARNAAEFYRSYLTRYNWLKRDSDYTNYLSDESFIRGTEYPDLYALILESKFKKFNDDFWDNSLDTLLRTILLFHFGSFKRAKQQLTRSKCVILNWIIWHQYSRDYGDLSLEIIREIFRYFADNPSHLKDFNPFFLQHFKSYGLTSVLAQFIEIKESEFFTNKQETVNALLRFFELFDNSTFDRMVGVELKPNHNNSNNTNITNTNSNDNNTDPNNLNSNNSIVTETNATIPLQQSQSSNLNPTASRSLNPPSSDIASPIPPTRNESPPTYQEPDIKRQRSNSSNKVTKKMGKAIKTPPKIDANDRFNSKKRIEKLKQTQLKQKQSDIANTAISNLLQFNNNDAGIVMAQLQAANDRIPVPTDTTTVTSTAEDVDILQLNGSRILLESTPIQNQQKLQITSKKTQTAIDSVPMDPGLQTTQTSKIPHTTPTITTSNASCSQTSTNNTRTGTINKKENDLQNQFISEMQLDSNDNDNESIGINEMDNEIKTNNNEMATSNESDEKNKY